MPPSSPAPRAMHLLALLLSRLLQSAHRLQNCVHCHGRQQYATISLDADGLGPILPQARAACRPLGRARRFSSLQSSHSSFHFSAMESRGSDRCCVVRCSSPAAAAVPTTLSSTADRCYRACRGRSALQHWSVQDRIERVGEDEMQMAGSGRQTDGRRGQSARGKFS